MNEMLPSQSALSCLTGRRLLAPEGLTDAPLAIDGAHCTDARPGPGLRLDAGHLLVLPGIVDLHGDAFERAVMPRPNVAFPYPLAMMDVDSQLIVNGITSTFHGLTLSWEGGLRGEHYALQLIQAMQTLRERFLSRHYVHLRFETHNVASVALAQTWIQNGDVHFLAFNNHLPSMVKREDSLSKMLQYAERAQCDVETFKARMHAAVAATDQVDDAMRALGQTALEAGLRIASHDDPDPETRRHYHALGCSVAEFPLSVEAAESARELGDTIVFGSPNVVRGGSHVGAPGAASMVGAGLCDILTSDYYYPAPLAAAMMLHRQGVVSLEHAWQKVSRNPARAAGLMDRGELAPGQLADAIVVDDSDPALPRVCAAIVGGHLRYLAPHPELRLTHTLP